MVAYCCAFNCNEKRTKGSPYSFHSFPRDEKRRKEWEKSLRRENFKATNSTKICSKHFEQDCFDKEKFGATWLKSDALPTIFDFPDHLSNKTIKRKPPKRLEDLNEPTSSLASSFEEKRKKRKYFLGDFEEEDMESPSKARRVLELANQQQNVKSPTIKRLKRENFRLTKKVASLQSLLQDIQNKLLITESAKSILEVSIQGTPAELLLSRLKKPGSKQEYPAELRAFALTLHFYSSKAYDYVRKNFQTCLPHPSTLRKWYQSIDGSPGFTDAALSALKMKVSEATKLNKTVICALIVDEMSIKKHIDWNKDKFIGYVDFGTGLDDDQLPVATEAYTFMLNCVNGHWKIPIGYFLINGLTAQERANIIQECLKIVHETGIEVVTLTLDGTSTNLSTIQYLGGSINASNLVYSFKHPISDNDIHVILDPCHMIKLVRNTLASKGSIFDGQGRMVKWEYIESLHKFQQEEGLLAATKVRTRHIQWKREKMKVKLATQVLSASVADALLYLEKDANLPEFRGCEATVEFIQCFNNLFDVMNSRNLLAKGLKGPMQSTNVEQILKFFAYVEVYIKNLRISSNGPLIIESNRKTGFLGFLTCIASVKSLYTFLIEQKSLKFLMTYKFSQDHLEMFFSAIRSRGGFNNNPTAKQFSAAYIRLLSHHQITSSINSNCLPLDKTNILNVTSAINHYILGINKFLHFNIVNEENAEESPIDLSQFRKLNIYIEDVVTYIAGFVVRKIKKSLSCKMCDFALTYDAKLSNLLIRKDRGGLIKPGGGVVHLCRVAEKTFRIFQSEDKLRNGHIMQILITHAMKNMSSSTFCILNDHILNQEAIENHKALLIKSVLFEYFKIRLHHIAKVYNEDLQKNKSRSINNKSTLFQGH